MIRFHASEAATLLCGRLVGADVVFDKVGSDSRVSQQGGLFIALSGEHFDGHDFVAHAAAQGAVAALVQRELPIAITQIVVEDSLYAFGELAAAWRQKSKAHVVGLTGSNGKTTVKEMIATLLRSQGNTLATMGNLNNAIGVPLTLTRLQDEDFAVIEMGANHAGEIHYLTSLVKPDVALLNNAGRAHLEGFGSLEGVARAKAEIINGLSAQGTFVCHADPKWLPLWRSLLSTKRLITFGLAADADFCLLPESVCCSWETEGFRQHFSFVHAGKTYEAALQLAGQHNCLNALAALAVTQACGLALTQGIAALTQLEPVKGRLKPLQTASHRIIDDTYNANPDSVAAAMRMLVTLPGRHVLVLGDLGELGADALALHGEIGSLAAQLGVAQLFTLGANSSEAAKAYGAAASASTTLDDLLAELQVRLQAGDTILVKGSRSSRMERVVDALLHFEERLAC